MAFRRTHEHIRTCKLSFEKSCFDVELMKVPAGVFFTVIARGRSAATGGSGKRLLVKCIDPQMKVHCPTAITPKPHGHSLPRKSVPRKSVRLICGPMQKSQLGHLTRIWPKFM